MHQRHATEVHCTPKTHQWDAWEATKRYQVVWMCGGLGAGKTWAMVWWVWLMATEWANEVDGLLFEPDFATYDDVFLQLWRQCIPGEGVLWDAVRTSAGGRHLRIHVRKSRTVTVFIRSALNMQNVVRSEGLSTVGWTAIDEPARMLCGQKAFTNSLGRSRVQIPGWSYNPIFMVGSPRGLGHWTADVMGCTTDHPALGYSTCYEPDPVKKPGYAIRACRTSDNADNLAQNYERNYRIAVGEALAAQEMNASLMFASGMVLPEWRTAIHVLPHAQLLEMWQRQIQRPMGGADWGYHTAASEVCGWTKDKELLVIDEWYEHGRTVIEQGVAMDRLTREYAARHAKSGRAVMPWYCDPADRGSRELLKKGFEHGGQQYVVGAKQAKNEWQPGVDLLRNLMSVRPGLDHPSHPPGNQLGRPGMFMSDRCTGFITEAPALRHLAKEEGKPLKDGFASADPLCDDHAVDAVRYPAYTTATTLPTRSYGRSRLAA
ncbi:MAG: hypothetical protein ABIH03_08760 [Pseudomonadota bacterium]